jgi:hypothetical protein
MKREKHRSEFRLFEGPDRTGRRRKKMKMQLIFGFVIAMSIPVAYGDSIGVAVNGTCEAGSCPAAPIPFNSTETLPFDFTFALPDGDTYLIYGSFTGTNNSDGGGSNVYGFEVVYEGNGIGGPSEADTITVQRDAAFQASISSADFVTRFIGAFSPGIAASSSASTCFDGTLACLGPAVPPGSFDQTSTFSISNTDGVLMTTKLSRTTLARVRPWAPILSGARPKPCRRPFRSLPLSACSHWAWAESSSEHTLVALRMRDTPAPYGPRRRRDIKP